MLKALINVFKVKDIRGRFLFTLAVLIVYRIGIQIPVPGVNLGRLLDTMGRGGGSPLMDFLNLFTGGALKRASIFSLGVMPYITSMIIMQLLTAVVPSIDRMVKEGPEGRKKFQQYGRYGTVIVTVIQGLIYARGLIAENTARGFLTVSSVSFIFLFTISVTAGTLVLMWMGEQITESGVGNGISLLIMAGIVSRLPSALYQLFLGAQKGAYDPLNLVIVLALFFFVIGLVTFEEQGLRKLPVHYAKRVAGGSNFGGQVSYLPFKVNPTGVIPIIFASAILIMPAQVSQWFGNKVGFLNMISHNLVPGKILYSAIYFLMILFFAYFYTEIELNPHDIAENLRKQGGFIPGIRPGEKTEDYISFVLGRITLPGAVFLGAIALTPSFVIRGMNIPSRLGYLMGGTSLIIMVGVALDTLKQLESHLLMHHMDGFFTKRKK